MRGDAGTQERRLAAARAANHAEPTRLSARDRRTDRRRRGRRGAGPDRDTRVDGGGGGGGNLSECAPRSSDSASGREACGERVVRCRRQEDVAAVCKPTHPGVVPNRYRRGLGGTVWGPIRTARPSSLAPSRNSARWSDTAAATASAASAKTETVESPSPIDWIRWPRCWQRACRAKPDARHTSGCRSQSSLEFQHP